MSFVRRKRACRRRNELPRPGLGGGLVPLLTAFSLCALLGAPLRGAQQGKPTEYEVKAAYLYNFGKFIEWPARGDPGGQDAFVICVLGKDPFGRALDTTIAGETIGDQKLVARRILRPDEALSCRILFISSSEEKRLPEAFAAVKEAGVLTVSDMPHFAKRGGMIQFTTQANRVRFEVNLTPAQEAGLIFSSELLKVAASVRKTPRPGA